MKHMRLLSTVASLITILVVGCSQIPTTPTTPTVPDGNDTTAGKGVRKLIIQVTPDGKFLTTGEQVQFFASVTCINDTLPVDQTVSWTIASGVGTITATGFYSAPTTLLNESETVVVKARSTVDASVVGTATITVRRPTLLPMSIGKYWVYDVYALDSLTNQRITSRKSTDSTIVLGNVLQGGKVTNMAINYRNNTAKDTTYYSTNADGSVWAYTRLNDNLSTLSMNRQWIKVLDPNSLTWVAFDSVLVNKPVNFNGVPSVANGRVTITGKREGVESISIDNASFSATKFTLTMTVQLVITTETGIDIPVQYSVPATQWYADNVGMVRAVTSLFQTTYPWGSMRKQIEESTLVRYVIK